MPEQFLYTLQDLWELNPDDRECYIEGFLYEGQICLLVGPPEAGKSYLLSQLNVHLAAGKSWTGNLVIPQPRRVLYVQTEGAAHDLAERTNPVTEELPSAIENFTAWFPEEFDLNHLPAKESGTGAGIYDLSRIIRENDIEILSLDSLFSSMHGSVNSDENAMAVKATLLKLQRQFPHLTIIILHHEHRPRKDQDGEIIDEGMQAYAGSWVWWAMADQWWRLYKQGNQTGTKRRFEQTKSRGREHRREGFYVELDFNTGKINPDESGLGAHDGLFRIWLKGMESATQAQIYKWCNDKQIHRQQRARMINRLLHDKVIEKEERATGETVYHWNK